MIRRLSQSGFSIDVPNTQWSGRRVRPGFKPCVLGASVSLVHMQLNRTVNPLSGLAVMLIANLLLCWYPLYQLRNYVPGDKPDASVLAVIIALSLTLATLLLVPLAMLKVWLHSRNLAYPKRIKTLTAALMMSLVMLAPVCYWIALFIRARNGGG